MKPEYLRQPNCHVRIAAEIIIELQAVTDHSQPRRQNRHSALCRDHRKCCSQLIRQQNFFCQTKQKALDSRKKLRAQQHNLAKLFFHIAVLRDRSGCYFRKE